MYKSQWANPPQMHLLPTKETSKIHEIHLKALLLCSLSICGTLLIQFKFSISTSTTSF